MKTLAIAALLLGSTQALAVEVGDQAPDVDLEIRWSSAETAHDSILALEEGDEFLILEFFSPTCSACTANFPHVVNLASAAARTATTRFVNINGSQRSHQRWLQSHRRQLSNSTVAFDRDEVAAEAFDIVATPTLFVVNSAGRVVYKHTGTLTDRDLAQIRRLVGAGAGGGGGGSGGGGGGGCGSGGCGGGCG